MLRDVKVRPNTGKKKPRPSMYQLKALLAGSSHAGAQLENIKIETGVIAIILD